MATAPGMLIALPHGLNVSGVATWAARLANSLAERHIASGLLLHDETEGSARLEIDLDPRVRTFSVPGPPIDACRGELSSYIPAYLAALRELHARTKAPVVLSPNLHGDCYGIAAAICTAEPEIVRVLGWQHSDIDYDTRLLEHFAPILSGAVGVSQTITRKLRSRPGLQRLPIHHIPYGVELGAAPRRTRPADGTLRLIYTGRLDHQQKRILALAHLSDTLSFSGIRHTLTVVGDGPARESLRAICGPCVRLIGAASPHSVRELLRQHDVFVLPSRYEGLSVSLLEALAAGCIPVVARTESGSDEAIDGPACGRIVDVAPDALESEVGAALAHAIVNLAKEDLAPVSAAARARAESHFSLCTHTDRVIALLDEAVRCAPKHWPTTRPCAFTATGSAGSGSVPPEGAGALAALLKQLEGRRVILHGTGQHTLQLAHVLGASPAMIVAFSDDDPSRRGSTLFNWPVIAPSDARQTGATDVVISSWINQDAIYARRSAYEAQGLRVHRIYL